MVFNRLHPILLLAPVACWGLLQAPLSAQPLTGLFQSANSSLLAQAPATNYPVINSMDWRSINAQNIPWSQPVTVQDAFDGNYLAVFDRNYKNLVVGGRASVVSEWARQFIRVVGFIGVDRCGPFLACGDNLAMARADYLEIKVGGQIFRIPGDGSGRFPVSPKLATALASAPAGDALIRVTFDGVGQPITSAVGAGTVKAWKVVYGQP